MEVHKNILFFICGWSSINGLIIGLYLFFNKKVRKNESNRLLGLIFFLLSVKTSFPVFCLINKIPGNFCNIYHLLTLAAYLILAGVLFLYSKSLTQKIFYFKFYHLFYFFPVVFIWLIPENYQNFSARFISLQSVFLVYILISAYLVIAQKNKQNKSKFRLNWLAGILTGILLIWISVFVGFFTELLAFFFVINIITIFILLEKKSIIRFDDYNKTNNLSIDNTESEKILSLLKKSMDIDKLYLDSDLTLPVLSEKTGISLHTISKVINDKLNKNFSEFVNSYRIVEARNKLIDKRFSHYSIAAIAYDCGFNSLSVFNTSFKKNVNLTPSQYRRLNAIPDYVNN